MHPAETPEHLFRRLLGAYLTGAETFAIEDPLGVTAQDRAVVGTFCQRTRAPRLVDEDRRTLRLHDEADPYAEPVARTIDRMGDLVIDFQREAVDAWTHLPFAGENRWEDRDDTIDREAWHLERLCAFGVGAEERGGPLGVWTVARSLEKVGDLAVSLGTVGPRLRRTAETSATVVALRQFHAQAVDHLRQALRARDGVAPNDVLDVGEALLASGRALQERLLPSNGDDVVPAEAGARALVLDAITRTVACSQDIAQVGLERLDDR